MGDKTLPMTGGCQCGAVCYRLDRPVQLTNHCHCTMCRRMQAAMFGTWSRIETQVLVIEKGEDALTDYKSSPPCIRRFCATCGCPLFYVHEVEPDLIWFTTATLDGGTHPGHPKEREQHVSTETKVPWHPIADGLPQYQKYPFFD
ncbi:MAG: GFA family protein [Alphaproteobacteria bacterium]